MRRRSQSTASLIIVMAWLLVSCGAASSLNGGASSPCTTPSGATPTPSSTPLPCGRFSAQPSVPISGTAPVSTIEPGFNAYHYALRMVATAHEQRSYFDGAEHVDTDATLAWTADYSDVPLAVKPQSDGLSWYIDASSIPVLSGRYTFSTMSPNSNLVCHGEIPVSLGSASIWSTSTLTHTLSGSGNPPSLSPRFERFALGYHPPISQELLAAQGKICSDQGGFGAPDVRPTIKEPFVDKLGDSWVGFSTDDAGISVDRAGGAPFEFPLDRMRTGAAFVLDSGSIPMDDGPTVTEVACATCGARVTFTFTPKR